jgi:hypothetical protein
MDTQSAGDVNHQRLYLKFPVFEFREQNLKEICSFLLHWPLESLERLTRGLRIQVTTDETEVELYVRASVPGDIKDARFTNMNSFQDNLVVAGATMSQIWGIPLGTAIEQPIFEKMMEKLQVTFTEKVTSKGGTLHYLPLQMWKRITQNLIFRGVPEVLSKVQKMVPQDFFELDEDDAFLTIQSYEPFPDFEKFLQTLETKGTVGQFLEIVQGKHGAKPNSPLEKCVKAVCDFTSTSKSMIRFAAPCSWSRICDPNCNEYFVEMVRLELLKSPLFFELKQNLKK